MNKLILTLCLIMMALIGASAVAASDDICNSSCFELCDESNIADMAIDDELSIPTNDENLNSDDNVQHVIPVFDEIPEPTCVYKTEKGFEKEYNITNKTGEETGIMSSNSTNNNSNNDGGAIYFEGNTFMSSNSTNNNSNNDGGAIYIENDTSINDTRYTQNYNPLWEKIMKVYGSHDTGNITNEELMTISDAYEEIISYYTTGHSVNDIGKEFCMSSYEIQKIADTYVKSIESDRKVDSVYKMYGSYKLEEISNHLGISPEETRNIVLCIKSGFYGQTYAKLFLRRDLISMNTDKSYYIIK